MGADGIARSVVLKNATIDLEEAVKNSKAVNDLYMDKKFPLLIDITAIHTITRDARAHFAVKNRETNISCFAIVTNSELGKIIGNFFFLLNSPDVPAKMFTDEVQAIQWLTNWL